VTRVMVESLCRQQATGVDTGMTTGPGNFRNLQPKSGLQEEQPSGTVRVWGGVVAAAIVYV